MGEMDFWIPYLPPKPMPDTGAKMLQNGEVWAFWDTDDERCVVRYADGSAVILAGEASSGARTSIAFSYSCSRATHAIRVAAADCEPEDPDLLYQFLYLEE